MRENRIEIWLVRSVHCGTEVYDAVCERMLEDTPSGPLDSITDRTHPITTTKSNEKSSGIFGKKSL